MQIDFVFMAPVKLVAAWALVHIFSYPPAMAAPAQVIEFYASQSGQLTLDRDDSGGNPFASALIEALGQPPLSFVDFQGRLIEVTGRRSRGFQRPAVRLPIELAGNWPLFLNDDTEKRVALVLVYSNYASTGMASLPGAEHDMHRVAHALNKAGFEVSALLDPDAEGLVVSLQAFSARSKTAGVALIYATGHGVEWKSKIYLLPRDYPASEGTRGLDDRAVNVAELGRRLRATRANLLFFGGCRNNPWDSR